MTDLHALITEMAAELDHCQQLLLDDRRQRHPLADRARAALAKPESIQDRIAPARAALAKREHIFPTPSQAAECGGPCYEGNYCPEACDCGLYKPPELAEPDGPAVPEGREPASVTGELSDADVLRVAAHALGYLSTPPWDFEPVPMSADDVLTIARAVLARWGRPAATPVPVSERLPRVVVIPLPAPEGGEVEGANG